MVEGAHQDTRPHTHQNPFQLAQIYPSKVERKESAKIQNKWHWKKIN